MYNTLADAMSLVAFAHRNQKDRAGFPYTNHLHRVLENVWNRGGTKDEQIAAILHDIVEDTAFTTEILLSLGISPGAVEIIDLVTRKPDVSDDEYYRRIGRHKGARRVKLADIDDNTLPWRMAHLKPETAARLTAKYNNARHKIRNAYIDYINEEGVEHEEYV